MKQQDRPQGGNEELSPLFAWIAMGLSLLIPGAGFILVGRVARGLTHLVLIGATWCIGLAFHATVIWPIWSVRDENFNLISNFTFIVQLGAGLPALACFLASTSASQSPEWLVGIEQHPFFELGSYFLIVAGALNYFAAGNFHDRIISRDSRFRAQESGEDDGGGCDNPGGTDKADSESGPGARA